MRLVIGIAVIFSVLSSVAVRASDAVAVFGLEFGKPFKANECPYKRLSKTLGVYGPPTTGICYQRMSDQDGGKRAPVLNAKVKLVWPYSLTPPPVAGSYAIASIVNGTLQGLSFDTSGVPLQDRDLALLTERFGEPAATAHPTREDGLGVKYQSIEAVWTLGNVSVIYASVVTSEDAGLVRVDSTNSPEAQQAALEKLAEVRPSAR
jgi:hypothetical protein